MKKWVGLSVILVVCVAGFYIYSEKKSNIISATLHNEKLQLAVADTTALQTQGLSGQKNLAENAGMIFVFRNSGMHQFWMKDMLFPLDIIWFDERHKIVSIKENVSPESYPEAFGPLLQSKYVLEVNAGYVKKHNIKIGDVINFD